uniref:Ras and Rab interactor 1 n=1 Tax=Suricata suricatta TaxID=37032 RepID=A0A673U3T3_SURSU
MFPDLVQLICAYCHTRDILLIPLQLPRAICQAATHKELEAISHLGIGKGSFVTRCTDGQAEGNREREGTWTHSLSLSLSLSLCLSLGWTPSPNLPEAPTAFSSLEFWSSSLNAKAQPGPPEGPLLPRLKPRSPQELDQGTGAALCFFNPLFPGDLGPTKREKFKRSFKVRVSTETSSPLSPPAVPPPPVPVPPGAAPSQTERLPPHQLLRRESSVGYRVPGSASPSLPPLPSLQEVDCGSPSSSEEEGVPGSQGSPATSPHLGHRRRRPLLRSMSAAFCSLLAPERQVSRAAGALVQDRHTAVGQLVQDLLTQVRAGPEPGELQGIREALSRARAMLSGELGPEKLLPPERLEHILEKSLHRSVLKPLRPILAARLRRRLSANGSLGRLAEGLRLARSQGPGAFGSHLSLPSPGEVEQVRQKLLLLLRAYSPSAQVKRLLQACKLLYTALRTQAGRPPPTTPTSPLLCQSKWGGGILEQHRLGDVSNTPISQMMQLRPREESILSTGPLSVVAIVTTSPKARQVEGRVTVRNKEWIPTLGPQRSLKLPPLPPAGESAGADEFLPLLSLVLAQCDLPELLLEAEYMSELLEPALLTGEGGYYLTSLSASLALLSGLDQAHTQPRSPSQELQRSLSLWEQRRPPATHSFQHLLRVAYQDPSSGCTSKTLAVPPGASVATLTQLCAAKFRVAQPDAFGLFLYREQGYHRLWPGALAHRLPSASYLVYRRAEQPETHGASPGATTEKGSGGLEVRGREEE